YHHFQCFGRSGFDAQQPKGDGGRGRQRVAAPRGARDDPVAEGKLVPGTRGAAGRETRGPGERLEGGRETYHHLRWHEGDVLIDRFLDLALAEDSLFGRDDAQLHSSARVGVLTQQPAHFPAALGNELQRRWNAALVFHAEQKGDGCGWQYDGLWHGGLRSGYQLGESRVLLQGLQESAGRPVRLVVARRHQP